MKSTTRAFCGLALTSALLGACGIEDEAALDDEPVAEETSAITAQPVAFTSLETTPLAMRLTFATNDPGTATLGILRMDREEAYYKRLAGVPLTPSGRYLYDDTSAIIGHEYCYVIVSRAPDQSRGTNSETRCLYHSGGTQTQPPATPTNLRIDRVRERSLRLAFVDASTDETGFTLERREGLGFITVATVPARAGSGQTVQIIDGDLDMEQSYSYRVRVHNGSLSAVTLEVSGKTSPLAVGDPVAQDRPVLITITHPRTGALNVSWLDQPGSNEWKVMLYEGLSNTPIGTATVRDHTSNPSVRQGYTADNLDPAKLYCFRVERGSKQSGRLCESPLAARTSPDQRDPSVAVTPVATGVRAPVNGRLTVDISNPQPGQVVERVRASTGERTTAFIDTVGQASFSDSGLAAGQTYCYRLWAWNLYGSRYTGFQCGTTTTDAPDRPDNFHVAAHEGRVMTLDWDSAKNATSYEFTWDGKRQSYTDHDGSDSTSGTSYTVTGYEGFTYCFKVRARNEFGSSGWRELCGVEVDDDGLTSYGTSLLPIIPTEGLVVYTHNVSPGGGPARLVNVHVAGNGFTPYSVRFLPPGSSNSSCGGSGGVIVPAGGDLTGGDLDTLYGAERPSLPLDLIACKIWLQPSVPSVDPMPIQVTFQR